MSTIPTQPRQIPTHPDRIDHPDTIELRTFVGNSKMLITIDPGSSQTRTHLNVVCVIDISISMETTATTHVEENTKREPFGLTILDIVKHAVTTVIKSLSSKDRLAIVTFSDSAHIVLPLMNMDPNGQDMALRTLKCLHSYAGANLWAGLEKGLNVLNRIDDEDDFNRFSTVMVFTYGVPNIIPPQGDLTTLQMYKNQLGCLPGSINMFGFGYRLDSKLLYSLANEGHGGYFFIPDKSFVGDLLVHAIANLKVTIAKSCRLSIEPLNGATFVSPKSDLGQYLTSEDSCGLVVDIGSIQTGQTKDIVLQMDNLPQQEGTPYALIRLTAKTRMNNSYALSAVCDSFEWNDRILPTYFRYKSIDVIKNAMKLVAEGDDVVGASFLIQTLIKEIEDVPPHEHSLAILQDIKGQVLEALNPSSFQKWGRHYLPSLMYAHIYQVCNNFKDIGPQVYGGQLFKVLRDGTATLFNNLPLPEPSARVARAVPMIHQVEPPSFFQRMFNNSRNSRNVCFHGKGMVRMVDGGKKNVNLIRKGDRIEISDGSTATVICVVETILAEKMIELVHCKCQDGSADALLITPWHPIRLGVSQEWIFPISIGQPKTVPAESVFNFVLDAIHIINVDGIDSVTLGHSFDDDPVCAHEYFGTKRVIDDLQSMSGYASGLVRVVGVQRDFITSNVVGLIEE